MIGEEGDVIGEVVTGGIEQKLDEEQAEEEDLDLSCSC